MSKAMSRPCPTPSQNTLKYYMCSQLTGSREFMPNLSDLSMNHHAHYLPIVNHWWARWACVATDWIAKIPLETCHVEAFAVPFLCRIGWTILVYHPWAPRDTPLACVSWQRFESQDHFWVRWIFGCLGHYWRGGNLKVLGLRREP